MVDVSPALDAAVKQVQKTDGAKDVQGMKVDVSKVDEVVAMREKVLEEYGEVSPSRLCWVKLTEQVHILMNNAGIGAQTPAFSLQTSLTDLQANWHKVLDTNFFGILNVAQAFAPHMAIQENASAIINTGSKQGITCPPGNAGYNVSKSAVKTFTEQRKSPLSTLKRRVTAKS